MVRLLELRIRNFRGIRRLDLSLSGQSAAILGPNGSGKSSVVDALDFLLTGRIDRLTGQGTGAVSLGKHGPHLSADAKSAFVEADFACGDPPELFSVRRSIAESDRLQELSDGELPNSLREYLILAESTKLHLLTRRQVLTFILAEPGKRSELVAALLRTETIDVLRKEIQGASKLAVENASRLNSAFATQGKALFRTVEPAAIGGEELLARINANRLALGAEAAADLTSANVLEGVPELAKAAANPLQTQRVRDAVRTLSTWTDTHEPEWLANAALCEETLAEYRANEERLQTVRAMRLVKAGRLLVDSDRCPLCLAKWDQNILLKHLDARLEEGEDALSEAKKIDDQCASVVNTLDEVLLALALIATTLKESHPNESAELVSRASELKRFVELNLRTSTNDSASEQDMAVARAKAQNTVASGKAIRRLASLMAKLPDLTGAQKAWDELNATSRQLAELIVTKNKLSNANTCSVHLELVHQSLIQARDEVLQNVYDNIALRFGEYYSAMHSHDSDGFAASIEPTKAGLKLEVDFHGIGAFPPAAVHSEGHQDSMGLCLFLALVDYLASGGAGPILLDDVVMSVDREHRRGIAQLLAKDFPSTQFLITTHDRVWWHQLRTTGLVNSQQQLAFPSWTLDGGPSVDSGPVGFLAEARKYLAENNVPAAAHALRRGVEMVGPELCDALAAHIRYRGDGNWSAGEYMDSALARYTRLLKKARAAAQSWKQDTSEIDERESTLTEANKTLGGERWAVNALVHFNDWAELQSPDFEPVLVAYEQLFAQFSCPNCDSMLCVIEEKGEDVALRCHCADANLNLKPKSK